MFVLTRQWSDSHLDYHRHPDESRVRVHGWAPLKRIQGQFFERPRSLRFVWNYVRQFGVYGVFVKILSRLKERERNEKYLAIGIGSIETRADGSQFQTGDIVCFFASNHPRCIDRLVLDDRFLVSASGLSWKIDPQSVSYIDAARFSIPEGSAFDELCGWSRYSGVDVPREKLQQQLHQARQHLHDVLSNKPRRVQHLQITPRPVRETAAAVRPAATAPLTAALFGVGNYAKICVIPNINRRISLRKIYDVDPLQLGGFPKGRLAFDTSDWPRDEDRFDVYFIAGYHHTHASLAVHALEQGRFAVVEKPLATTLEDYQALRHANDQNGGRLFAGFHKRYSLLSEWACQDLALSPGAPIHYHCIVYEVPVPRYHWYRWPNSRGKILCNGCHWIDHFIFLNGFADVASYSARTFSNGDVQVAMELENQAIFSMILTSIGSTIAGKRDYVELRTAGRVVRIIDDKKYESESDSRVIRRRSVSIMKTYARMYREITRQIATREAGEDRRSLRSTEISILLEQQLADDRRRPTGVIDATRTILGETT